MTKTRPYKKRTVIIYFGATKQDYLNMVESKKHRVFLEYVQPLLHAQLQPEQHHEGCDDQSHYTIHSQRNRQLQGISGQKESIPICRVRCQTCGSVFTVLPSFIMRYRLQDTDCVGKLLEMNLGMGLSLRETATIYSWMDMERRWQPGWVWNLVQWFGQLLPVHLLLMRMGLTPPKHLLSDEKFAVLDGEKVYLFLVSEQELIWYGKWMSDSGEDCFTQTIEAFSEGMTESGHISGHLQEAEDYEPTSTTTDGWLASQNAWQKQFPDITLIECSFHGKKRVTASLDDYVKANSEHSPQQIREVKDNFNAILSAPTLAAYSQRIRQNLIRYQEQPILVKRMNNPAASSGVSNLKEFQLIIYM